MNPGGDSGDELVTPSAPSQLLLQELEHQTAFLGRRISRQHAGVANGGALAPEEVGRALRQLLRRQEADDSTGRALSEWRQVAVMADRILFWFFLVITMVSSLLFLVVLPVYKRNQYQRPD